MTVTVKEKKEFRFKTGPVVVSRAYLEPVKEPNQFGRWINSMEVFPDEGNDLKEMRQIIVECAKYNGKTTNESLKQTLAGIFQKLENTGKNPERNTHLIDKTFFSLNRSRNPGDRNLADPQERKEWLAYMANERPKAYLINKEGKREFIPVEKLRALIYPGCVVNIVGECYFAGPPFNRVCIDLQAVVLLEQRDRIGPAPKSKNDEEDPLLNAIAEPSKNQGDDLDSIFGDTDDLPF